MAFFIATMRVCKHSTPVSVFALRHENTLFFCSIGGKSGAEEGQQKLGKISTSNHESRRSYIVITGVCRTKQLVRQTLQFIGFSQLSDMEFFVDPKNEMSETEIHPLCG